MTINNFHNLDDDIKLDNIVIMTIKTTIYYCLITRQGASFDVEVRRTASASLGNIIVTSKVLQTGGTVNVNASWC
jgi:hypothetical protein